VTIQYKYPDDSRGMARQFVHNDNVIPANFLSQRDGETDADWVARLGAVGVTPIRVTPSSADPNQYDAGDPDEATAESGVIEISYPNPVAKTPYWHKQNRERMFVSTDTAVPDTYTASEPPYGVYSVWDADAGDWGVDVARVKAARQIEIRNAADNALADALAEYGEMEMATWDQQFSEAQDYQADSAADVPLLAAIASARGMAVADLAARIIANRSAWVTVSGAVVGQRLAYQDALDAATTYDEIMAIEVSYE
jgi:hypothetical protein